MVNHPFSIHTISFNLRLHQQFSPQRNSNISKNLRYNFLLERCNDLTFMICKDYLGYFLHFQHYIFPVVFPIHLRFAGNDSSIIRQFICFQSQLFILKFVGSNCLLGEHYNQMTQYAILAIPITPKYQFQAIQAFGLDYETLELIWSYQSKVKKMEYEGGTYFSQKNLRQKF